MHCPISQSEFVPHCVSQSPQAFSLYSMSVHPPPQFRVPGGQRQVPLMQLPEQQPCPFGQESPRNPQQESPSQAPLQHSSAMLRVQYVPAGRQEGARPAVELPPVLIEPPALIPPVVPPPLAPLLAPAVPPEPPLVAAPPVLVAPAPASPAVMAPSPASLLPPLPALPLEAPPRPAAVGPLAFESSSGPPHAIQTIGVNATSPQKRKTAIVRR
jgi:hypothetical protein